MPKISKRGGFSDRNKIKPINTEIQLKDFADAILGCRFARRGMQLFLRRDLSLRRLDRGSRSSFGP